MFHTIILSVHILLCFILVGLVLLQQGKGAEAGIALGGGSNTVFGASGAASVIVKLTTTVAVLFMVTSVYLVRSYAGMAKSGHGEISVSDPGLAPKVPSANTSNESGAKIVSEQQSSSPEAVKESPVEAPVVGAAPSTVENAPMQNAATETKAGKAEESAVVPTAPKSHAGSKSAKHKAVK